MPRYIAKPKSTGYRAIHVMVRKRGEIVEVQLQTSFQHRWAGIVKREDELRGNDDLKDGKDLSQLAEDLRILAAVYDAIETDSDPPEGWREAIARIRSIDEAYT